MANNFSIIMAYKEDSDIRKKIFDWTMRRYKFIFPQAEIIIGEDDSKSKDFCKARAINNAVAQSKYDNLLITDVDIILDKRAISLGLNMVNDYCLITPFDCFWRLPQNYSKEIMSMPPEKFIISRYEPCGTQYVVNKNGGTGIQILTKRNFYSVGGYDERFVGWGGEDNAFVIAVRTMCNKDWFIMRKFMSFHLWHPKQDSRKDYLENKKNNNKVLRKRYADADGDKEKIKKLLNR